ncbi:divergent PAP2 family protein [Candidatus Woesearchaeota archaeon]|nr:divergent PAP2 family protein [Candidatus Woesearchaeota archaeon]
MQYLMKNKIFLAVILAAIISQLIKIVLNSVKYKKSISLADLIVTGGMPSTHSALVSSLFAIMLLETGLSPLTVVSIVLFIVVITDSMGVRRTAGEEAEALNKIIKTEKLKMQLLSYSAGHKPIQVLAGIAIGFFFAVLIYLA